MRAALAVALLAGCATAAPADKAREGLAVLAVAGQRADLALAHEYQRRAPAALDAANSFADYTDKMAALNAAVDALRVFRMALMAAEASVDASDAEGLLPAMGCVAEAARRMASAFDAARVSLPASFAKAIAGLPPLPACGVSDAR